MPKIDFETFFRRSNDLCCVVSADGALEVVNPAFVTALGWSEQELLRRPFTELVHEDDAAATTRQMTELVEGAPLPCFESRLRCKDGGYRWMRWSVQSAGANGGLYAIGHDVTEDKRAHDLIQVAVEASPAALVLVDAEGRIRVVNAEAERMFGYDRAELIGEPVEVLVPEEVREGHVEARHKYAAHPGRRAMGHARDLVGVTKQGWPVPVEIGLSEVDTAEGKLTLALLVDITMRKAMERRLRTAHERIRGIVEALPDLIYRVDRDGNALEFLGQDDTGSELEMPPSAYVGQTVRKALPAAAAPRVLDQIARALDGTEVVIEEYVISFPSGPQDYEARMVRIEEDEVIVIVRNITRRMSALRELERAREQEQYLASHDPLTGLPNRRMFHDELGRAIGRAERHDRGIGVLFLDLDGFKEVNDQLGHEAGDELLRSVADRIRDLVRKNDVLARLGGDEFTLAVEDVAIPEGLIVLAEKVVESLARPFGLRAGEARVTASVGIAAYPDHGDSPDALIRHADAAMYQAKKSGKNAFRFYDDD